MNQIEIEKYFLYLLNLFCTIHFYMFIKNRQHPKTDFFKIGEICKAINSAFMI